MKQLRLAASWPIGLALIGILLICSPAPATPPVYSSFDRVQEIDPDIREEDILRIWTAYIGQGDAILIQLPARFAYTLNGQPETIEILVDGGPGLALQAFLRTLPSPPARIEYAVLTHHDNDHVAGLTRLVTSDEFGVERIYHNGLVSWRRTPALFPEPTPARRIVDGDRGMALLEPDGLTMQSSYLIDDLASLTTAVRSDTLVSVYEDLGDAVVDTSQPFAVSEFPRTHRGGTFIGDSGGPSLGEVTCEVLWPRNPTRRYAGWSHSINGNSVTFRLSYGGFSMLFTGDHNHASEADLLALLTDPSTNLGSDVLKVPHHGSQDNERAFFDAVDPVVSVASMGSLGVRRYGHPARDVISWLGGPHRIYHTFLHERWFVHSHLDDDNARDGLVEETHVLIETDGDWFRVVEVTDPRNIDTVRQVRRGNGTRWIWSRE